jgi:hypothetical protein
MSEAHTHESSTAAATRPHFSDEVWAHLQEEDRKAGALVIGLMTVIFTIGLVLYFTICLSV